MGSKVPGEGDGLHDLSRDSFHERVHTFGHWFDSVNGYLEGRPLGYKEDLSAGEISPEVRDRLIATLCNYCVGETAALEGSGGLIRVAPNRSAKIFIATQAVDEARHLEVFTNRLRELGVEDPEAEIVSRAHPSLLKFKEKLLALVDQGDWLRAVFAQNVILEAMEFTVFQRHSTETDPITQDLLSGIINDERRHIGFGENELGRCLHADPGAAEKLVAVRQQLDPLVLETFDLALRDMGAPANERTELGRDYMDAVGRLGIA
ncbi:MAG: ferritin-like domain-containing protein [bacterium]|nr:ferritin-like domain-containing protein [bacterium]MCP5065212.1 ferritin-like domain-containing protein [bacterium]